MCRANMNKQEIVDHFKVFPVFEFLHRCCWVVFCKTGSPPSHCADIGGNPSPASTPASCCRQVFHADDCGRVDVKCIEYQFVEDVTMFRGSQGKSNDGSIPLFVTLDNIGHRLKSHSESARECDRVFVVIKLRVNTGGPTCAPFENRILLGFLSHPLSTNPETLNLHLGRL